MPAGAAPTAPAPRSRNHQQPVDAHPIVRYGCTAGFVATAATVFAGAFAAATARPQLSARMVRWRLVALGPTLGLYVTGTGFFPPPKFFDTVAGRAPRIPRTAAFGGGGGGGGGGGAAASR
jgi:hypothetical protein